MFQCSVIGCHQMVIDQTERSKNRPMCYFHSKCRDRLFAEPHEYPHMFPDVMWYKGDSDSIHRGGKWSWHLATR
jgi:hypothetical protein